MSTITTLPEILRKTPNETWKAAINFANYLETGETITAASATVSPSGELTVSSVAASGQGVNMTIADGLSATRAYTITVQITSSVDEIFEVKARVRVYD